MNPSEKPRPSGRRWILVLVAVLVAALGVPIGEPGRPHRVEAVPATAARTPDTGPPGVLPAGGRWTVTLLTGEVVDVQADRDGRVTARAPEQRAPLRTVQVPGGDLYVMPVTVMGLVGRSLDRELFNVTGLVRQGYDDGASDAIPLIVQDAPGARAGGTAMPAATTERALPSIGARAVDVPKASTPDLGGELAARGGDGSTDGAVDVLGATRVWLDRRVEALGAQSALAAPSAPSAPPAPAALPAAAGPGQSPEQPPLDRNLTQIGADQAWAAGLTGDGVPVAVLDTGVDPRHPDLLGQVVAEENFSDSADAADRFGHGTHVASLVAGTGAASAGARSGVAPAADLLNGKVLDDEGFGELSDVIAGMEWAAPQAGIVNMSLGTGLPSDGSDPLSTALDHLTEQHGTLFVVAAGNEGPRSGSVTIPGAADRALTVGAVDGQDHLAEFSGRGPLTGSYELKPEVVAPGVDIVAARAAETGLGAPVGDHYVSLEGTSMAAPHVAGAAAVLAQQHPDWTGDQLRHALIGSTAPIDADGFDAGAGRIDVAAAMASPVQAGRDVLDVALAHPRTQPHTETLAWTNTSSTPQTVALGAELEDREGNAVGAVSVEPAALTLDPGATGTATLRVDGPELEAGLHSGTVTAQTPDGHRARLPIGVRAAPPMADLTIEATSVRGPAAPDPEVGIDIVNLDDAAELSWVGGFTGRTFTIQVPRGRYSVTGAVGHPDADDMAVAQVGDPDVTVTGDTTVAFDGAAAVPFTPRVEGTEMGPPTGTVATLSVMPRAGTGGYPFVSWTAVLYPTPPLRLTPMEGPSDQFTARQAFRLQAPHITARVGGSPLDIATVPGTPTLAEGEHTLPAVDAGDGSDLSGARDRLAVVQLPADRQARLAVAQRAAEAGATALAFVDERRTRLTLGMQQGYERAQLPIVTVAGASVGVLRAAAASGAAVTVRMVPGRHVYDVVTPQADHLDPEPVVTRADQAEMATLDERFHRDPDGRGATSDVRYADSVLPLLGFESHGPLPRRRTAHVSPGVVWQSGARGGSLEDWGAGPEVINRTTLSLGPLTSYAGGSEHSLGWLRRPQWPAPGGTLAATGGVWCSLPTVRTADRFDVFLSAFTEGPGRESCSRPLGARLSLERDGAPLGTVEGDVMGSFPIPAEPGTYRLGYEQEGQAPYAHRSSTWWTFRSAAPTDAEWGFVPLLTVDHQLPLDVHNRPTGDAATLRVGQNVGGEIRAVEVDVPTVSTSVDDGATWQPARVVRTGADTFRFRLPRTRGGSTGVSLRIDARGPEGSRIEQTLIDAYTS